MTEHLLNEIEEVMNDLGVKTSSLRVPLPVNVTDILDKVKRWDRLTVLKATSSFLLITSPEIYTELTSSLQVNTTKVKILHKIMKSYTFTFSAVLFFKIINTLSQINNFCNNRLRC